MSDTNPHVERSGRQLTFVSGPSPGTLFVGSVLLVAAIIVFAGGGPTAIGVVVVLVIIGGILLASSASQAVEIDLATRRLRLIRQFANLWTRTIVDQPFDRCRVLGVIMYSQNGRNWWRAYFQLENSQRYSIPIPKLTFTGTVAYVRELSEKTGIPFEETPMVEILPDAS